MTKTNKHLSYSHSVDEEFKYGLLAEWFWLRSLTRLQSLGLQLSEGLTGLVIQSCEWKLQLLYAHPLRAAHDIAVGFSKNK